MSLHKRLMSMDGRYKSNAGAIAETTRLVAKIDPALDNCSCVVPLHHIHVVIRVEPKNTPHGHGHGHGQEQEAVSFAHRSFGITKLRSSRLIILAVIYLTIAAIKY